VGSFPTGASPYGLLDMAGNAAEWVADWFAEDYYGQSPPQNPTGPAGGTRRVIRGTISNAGGGPEKCRTVARHSSEPEAPRYIYGFRCVSTTQP
jgi:formylglycine-generating enzyme required for sulfatase activity